MIPHRLFTTLMLFSLFLLPGCEAIANIFQAGIWTGIILVILVVVLVVYAFFKIFD